MFIQSCSCMYLNQIWVEPRPPRHVVGQHSRSHWTPVWNPPARSMFVVDGATQQCGSGVVGRPCDVPCAVRRVPRAEAPRHSATEIRVRMPGVRLVQVICDTRTRPPHLPIKRGCLDVACVAAILVSLHGSGAVVAGVGLHTPRRHMSINIARCGPC